MHNASKMSQIDKHSCGVAASCKAAHPGGPRPPQGSPGPPKGPQAQNGVVGPVLEMDCCYSGEGRVGPVLEMDCCYFGEGVVGPVLEMDCCYSVAGAALDCCYFRM